MQFPRKFMYFSIAVITLSLQQNSARLFGAARPPLFVQNPILAQGITRQYICENIPGLSSKQQEICMLKPKAMIAISGGFNMATKECENQFQHSRWNCTSLRSRDHLFETRAVAGTREAAFFSAITSAGITHAVATSCSQDNDSDCSCNELTPDSTIKNLRQKFKWDGCSVNIKQGLKTALEFLREHDLKVTSENDKRAFNLMHRHNIKAGRQVVKDLITTKCRCHGVSESCSMKSCWTTLPTMNQIGKTLKEKHRRARKVKPLFHGSRSGKIASALVLAERRNSMKPRLKSLVYIKQSPNYCEKNTALNIIGTFGRICNKSAENMSGCKLLCCGRGYDTHVEKKQTRCKCKFHWCCFVKCKTCVTSVEKQRCK